MKTRQIKEKVQEILVKTLPFLKKLFAEKLIPNAIKKGYEVFDNFADEKIEALAEQVVKYQNAVTSEKRDNYRKGILLGSLLLRGVAEKLVTAADEFKKAVNE